MDLDERAKKAFDFAADLTKQLITLATGIIALTITFSHDFLSHPESAAKGYAYSAWYWFLASIVFGILTLCALAGNLGAKDKSKAPRIFAPNIIIFSIPQFIAFFVGLLLTVLYARNTF